MEMFATILILSLASWIPIHGDCQEIPYNVVDVFQYGAIGDGITDDSQAFLEAWEAVCGPISNAPVLYIPAGSTFLLKPVTFNGPCTFPFINVLVSGKILAPDNTNAWEGYDFRNWVTFKNVSGLTINGDGQIDGNGAIWWLNGMDETVERPKALAFYNCNNLQLSGLTHINSPKNHIYIQGSNGVFIFNLQIYAPETSPNTDGIDLSFSTNVQIHDCIIGTGDDCIAIGRGSSYINITGVQCGPGHGISIGSLGAQGRTDTVEEVHVQGCSFRGTTNGARIKTWQGGSGYARRISFEDITLDAVDNPIIIDQYYCINNENGCKIKTSAVQVSDVLYNGVHGTSITEEAVKINCSQSIACTNLVFNDINITSAYPGETTRSVIFNAEGTSAPSVPALNYLSPPKPRRV